MRFLEREILLLGTANQRESKRSSERDEVEGEEEEAAGASNANGRREVEGCGREDDGWEGKYATLAFRAEDCMMLLGVK